MTQTEYKVEIEEKYDTKVLNSKQVCKELGCSKPTLFKYIKENRVKSFKVGNDLKFTTNEVANSYIAMINNEWSN